MLKFRRTMSVAVLIIFTAGAVTAGVAGRALFPGLEDAETIFPVLSNNLFPEIISGMLLVVVLSAIMSTVDSLLLLASSAVVRDTYQKIIGTVKSDAALSNYGKLVTVIIGAIAVVFAIQEPRVIFDFVLASWSGLGSAFGPAFSITNASPGPVSCPASWVASWSMSPGWPGSRTTFTASMRQFRVLPRVLP